MNQNEKDKNYKYLNITNSSSKNIVDNNKVRTHQLPQKYPKKRTS